VRVELEQLDGEVTLQVEDNGGGIEADKLADPNSLGLLGMRERAASLRGDLTVYKNEKNGTTVAARLPI
jgi:signal transduction histidine kinase